MSNSTKVPRAKFLGIDGLSCFISICKFGSFKNPFVKITSLSKLYFRFRRLILLVQMKNVIFMNFDSSTNSWKLWRWVRLDLIPTMRDQHHQHKSSHKCCEWVDGKSVETEATTWWEFPNGGKVIVGQILVSEEINKIQKSRFWESQSGIQVGELTIWVRSFDIEKLSQSLPGLLVPRE